MPDYIYLGGDAKTAMLIGQTPNPREMIDCSASAIGSIPVDADIVCPGPHWSVANVAAAMARAPGAVILPICDLNQVGVTSSGVSFADCGAFDDELNLGYNTLTDAQNANIGWLAMHQAANPGQLGLSYMWRGNLGTFLTAAQAQGCAGSYMWPADHTNIIHSYDYAPGYPSGYLQVATQWIGTSAGPVDISTVTDINWLVNYSLRKPVELWKPAARLITPPKNGLLVEKYKVTCPNGGWTIFDNEEKAVQYTDRANGYEKVPEPTYQLTGPNPAKELHVPAWRELDCVTRTKKHKVEVYYP